MKFLRFFWSWNFFWTCWTVSVGAVLLAIAFALAGCDDVRPEFQDASQHECPAQDAMRCPVQNGEASIDAGPITYEQFFAWQDEQMQMCLDNGGTIYTFLEGNRLRWRCWQ